MVYLLGVAIVARSGRWPSVLAAVINVASFDRSSSGFEWSFAVSDMQYLLTFGVMLAVGIIIGNLTAGVRYQARVARYREQRARHLYEMSRGLSRALTVADIANTSRHFLSSSFEAKTVLLLPQEDGRLQQMVGEEGGLLSVDEAIARWSFDKGLPAGAGHLPGVPYQLLPLNTPSRPSACWRSKPNNLRQLMVPEQQRLLQTFAVLIASALERLHTARSEKPLDAEREQLRNSLLAALSHDLRTPLTVLFGQAEILTLDGGRRFQSRHRASQIRQQVLSTTRLVNNLLDMARIQSGGFSLRRVAVAGRDRRLAAHMLEPLLSQHPIVVELPPESGELRAACWSGCSPTCWKTPISRHRGHHRHSRARCPSGWKSRSGITAPASPPISCS